MITDDEYPLLAEGPLRLAGFTASEAHFAAALIEHAELAAGAEGPPDGAAAWIATLLPPSWVCRLLANHVTDVVEGVKIFEKANDNPDLVRRLDLRADALDANCRDHVIGPNALFYRLKMASNEAH